MVTDTPHPKKIVIVTKQYLSCRKIFSCSKNLQACIAKQKEDIGTVGLSMIHCE